MMSFPVRPSAKICIDMQFLCRVVLFTNTICQFCGAARFTQTYPPSYQHSMRVSLLSAREFRCTKRSFLRLLRILIPSLDVVVSCCVPK